MAEKNLNLAKIKAYDDIKRMLQFLNEEQESIKGTANKWEFYRMNIETIYDNVFKNKIPVVEYESIIFDICIGKTLIMGDTNENKIYRKVEEAILRYNIRCKDLISEKISLSIGSDPRARGLIKGIVDAKYKEIVTPLIAGTIRDLIPNKEIDSREIIATVKKERYDLDTVTISKIFSKELKAYQEKNRDRFKRDREMKRRFGKTAEIKRDTRAPSAKTHAEKMNIIIEREKKRKKEFISSLGAIMFKLTETYLDDNTRVFVHTAKYKQKRIVIISYALEGEIDNVSILFESTHGKGEEFFFDLSELHVLDEKVAPTFIKNKLGLFSKVLGVAGILEAIWFLNSVLTSERKLPFKTVEYIRDCFLIYFDEIESEIYKMTVNKAIHGKI